MAPHLCRPRPDDQPPNTRALAEWTYRLTTSLLITAGVVPTTTEDELRAFVANLLSLIRPDRR